MKTPHHLWYLEKDVERARQAYIEAANRRDSKAPGLANLYFHILHKFRCEMRAYAANLRDGDHE